MPNAIAAFFLYLRDRTSKTPNCYFGWTEGNPFAYVIRYILFGEGDTAPVTHKVLREAEPNLERDPASTSEVDEACAWITFHPNSRASIS